MSEKKRRARMLKIPTDHSMAGGKFDSLRVEVNNKRTDVFIDYQELRLSAPSELLEVDGRPVEKINGLYLPRRISFKDAVINKQNGLFSNSSKVQDNDPGRGIISALHWRNPRGQQYHLLGLRSDQPSALLMTAKKVENQSRSGSTMAVSMTRDWSPVPDEPARWVPNPQHTRQRFAGDPVSIRLDGQGYHQRLFIGGLDFQDKHRPQVNFVLNLGENPSQWADGIDSHPGDRWVIKGEGRQGMRVSEIVEESNWVAQRLLAGKSVLVHCSAGMNRSATICCGTLILLEGLSAEAALERVRRQHPWAKPDPFHWINLRWLAQTGSL